MNKLKRALVLIASVVLVMALALTVTACGDSGSGGGGDNETPKITVTLDKTDVTLIVGDETTVTATVTGTEEQIAFNSDNVDVAIVQYEEGSKTVTIKAVGRGETVIHAKVAGIDKTVNVNVPGDYKLTVSDNLKTTASEGATGTITVQSNKDVAFSIDDTRAASMAVEGKTATISVKHAGFATVTVTVGEGDTAQTAKVEMSFTDEWNDAALAAEEGLFEYKELKVKVETPETVEDGEEGSEGEQPPVEDEYIVTGYEISLVEGAFLPEVLRIPATHNGKYVTALKEDFMHETDQADLKYDTVKEIYLPYSLTAVAANAFFGSKINKVYFQEDSYITEFKTQAFNTMSELTDISIAELSRLKTIERGVFWGAGKVGAWNKMFTVPKSVTLVGFGAFTASGFEKIEFEADDNPENGVTLQGTNASPTDVGVFFSATNLKELYLRNIKDWQQCILQLATSLELLSIDEVTEASAFGSITKTFGFLYAFKADGSTVIQFEGNNKVAKTIKEMGAGFGDECGGMLGYDLTAAGVPPANLVNTIYISNDTADADISAYIKKIFEKAETSDKDGYAKWTRKA